MTSESENKESRIPEEAKQILGKIASNWDDIIDPKALHVVPLKGAMTNEVYQIKWPTNQINKQHSPSRKVLVRIYGEGVDIFFDRQNEIRTFEFMSRQGHGPRLLGRFAKGRIEEFIHARTLSAPDLRDPEISALIAAKLKEFHDLEMPGPKSISLWDRLRKWLDAAKRMCSAEEVQDFRLDTLQDEISVLEKNISGDHRRVGFCHNDLQYGNIMIDEETRAITIIDYEYASYNPVAFDIANHFCEMGADYHTETPHILDYSKYPGLEERRRFVSIYLSCSGTQPSESEVEQLLQEVEKYTLASHLFWGLWGIISHLNPVRYIMKGPRKDGRDETYYEIYALRPMYFAQEHVNKIDFDYKEYARQRFQQYCLKKHELLGSSVRHIRAISGYFVFVLQDYCIGLTVYAFRLKVLVIVCKHGTGMKSRQGIASMGQE